MAGELEPPAGRRAARAISFMSMANCHSGGIRDAAYVVRWQSIINSLGDAGRVGLFRGWLSDSPCTSQAGRGPLAAASSWPS